MHALVRFQDEDAVNPALVGHKFVSLARASRAGFAVPPAVAISTVAHQHYHRTHTWPDGLLHMVISTANELGLIGTGLSVRSSATLEDLANLSFAGQYQSFLKIDTPGELIKKIEQCWESTNNQAVQGYLASADFPAISIDGLDEGATPAMSVIMQRMVPARAAGVAFGRDPMNPARRMVVIEAVEGLADSLVNGSATPQRAEVDTRGRVRLQTSHKQGPAFTNGLLSNSQWRSIAAMARSLESLHNRNPLDIEWAIDFNNHLWLLQARRISYLNTDKGVPNGTWTRKIADDLWADRLTPFMADAFIENSSKYDLSSIAKRLGLSTSGSSLAVINGYLYVNCGHLLQTLSLIPPKLRMADLKAMFPPSVKLDTVSGPSFATLARIALKTLRLAAMEPSSVPLICLKRARHFQADMHRRFDALLQGPAADARQAFTRAEEALNLMVHAQIHNQFPYAYATLFTWLLRWLVVDVQKRSHTNFLSLISVGGNNVSITIEREIRRMAVQINRETLLRSKFTTASAEELKNDLPELLTGDLNEFLQKYGCRSRHRTLYLKRWTEAPEEVLGMLKALVTGSREAGDIEEPPGRADRFSAPVFGFRCLSYAGRLAQPLIRPVQWLTRSFLDLREDLRFLLDKALYHIRLSLLDTGRFLGLDDKILFLTCREIRQLIDGEMSHEKARMLARQRFKQFMIPYTPSPFIVNRFPLEEADDGESTLRGLGTSPGCAVGRARIVDDPFKANVENGDILIARHTDPGWTPILSRVAGMVMEEGGLLNHCSIVARELGVPAVVGIAHATRRIPEGARVMLDGGLGIIRIEMTPPCD